MFNYSVNLSVYDLYALSGHFASVSSPWCLYGPQPPAGICGTTWPVLINALILLHFVPGAPSPLGSGLML